MYVTCTYSGEKWGWDFRRFGGRSRGSERGSASFGSAYDGFHVNFLSDEGYGKRYNARER